MDPERWKQIEQLCQAALEREESQRSAFLKEACGGDEALCREVDSLLAQQQEVEGFIEAPALEVVAKGLAKDQIESLIGQQISSYKILSLLGAGGMGAVFLAQDTTLDRKVALKFLPEELQQDSTARKRFLREAKSAAALDHPYICKVYEVGEEEGKSFIALEYIRGTTLQEKLGEGPLALKEVLEKATEIAEALEEAHKQGIVHRDVKPANIMLTPQGHVKVMDFGLAKRLAPAESFEGQVQILPANLTQTGMTLGTLGYMSPEQLRGEEVDTRSDIFSFGVVLYEMLTGVHPFKKAQPVETGNAVLNEAPAPLPQYMDEVHPILQHTVKKMLAKEPARRYQHIADVRIDLEEVSTEIVELPLEARAVAGALSEAASEGVAAPLPERPWRQAIPWSITIVVIIMAGFALWSLTRPASRLLTRFVVTLPPDLQLVETTDSYPLALSPQGDRLVYAAWSGGGRAQLYLRTLDQLEAQPMPGTEGALEPFFSPDGQWVGFFADGKLQKVSVAGGVPLTICDIPGGGRPHGVSWGPHDTIVFTEFDSGLWRVSGDQELGICLNSLVVNRSTAPVPSASFQNRLPGTPSLVDRHVTLLPSGVHCGSRLLPSKVRRVNVSRKMS